MAPHLLSFRLIVHPKEWVICTGMGTSALADVVIAVAMCWYLHRKRRKLPRLVLVIFLAELNLTSKYRTDSIVITLAFYGVNSGLVTR